MLASSSETRKVAERKPALLDMSVPFVKRDRARAVDDEDAEVEEVGRGMKFTLLTKKGSKQQVRSFRSLG